MDTILIIDDSTFARSKTRRILESNGYAVVEASSGEEGVAAVSKAVPSLVTLDLLMPGMSGMETLRQIKMIAPSLKVIILTADIQDQTRLEMLQAGADAFLNKPVAEAELLNGIRALLQPGE